MAPYTFELFAPYNKQAGLRLKNASARMFGLDIPMEFNEKDGHWRTTIDLADGIYHYQYKIITKSWFEKEPEPAVLDSVDGETQRECLSNGNDQLVDEGGKEATFTEIWYTFVDPNATAVDERGSEDAHKAVGILILKNGKRITDEYEWKYDNAVPLVPNEKLIIYEIHIGDFYSHFKDVTARMDYFVQLGVTAVEIMPIGEFPGAIGWGYTPRYYFAVESSYGTTYDLKEMIDTFHKNGIRVIMDGVYNHCDVSAPYTAIDHDYWFHHEPKDQVYSWGPEWNYGKYDSKYNVWPARKYIGESVQYYINEFHTDGIRFDAAGNIANDDFLKAIVQQSKEQARNRGYAPEFFCVGEYLPEEPEHVITNGGPVDALWHDSFYWKLRDALVFDLPDWEELKNVIDGHRQGYGNVVDVVNYQSNHDHDRLLVEIGKERQIFDKDASRRVRMALAVQATSFGLLMIWMGAEIGEYKEKTPGSAKIDWSLIDDRDDCSNYINKEQLQYYKDIILLRKTNPALTSPNIEFIFEQVNDQIMAWHRWTDSSSNGNHLIIVCNWSKETTYQTYDILNIPYNGKWYEWLNDNKEYIVDNNRLIIDDFPDHTARIFVYESRKKIMSIWIVKFSFIIVVFFFLYY